MTPTRKITRTELLHVYGGNKTENEKAEQGAAAEIQGKVKGTKTSFIPNEIKHHQLTDQARQHGTSSIYSYQGGQKKKEGTPYPPTLIIPGTQSKKPVLDCAESVRVRLQKSS
jgi:hypothetical protein